MNTQEIIAGNFDLRKLTKTCNFIGCEKPASMEALVIEVDSITGKRKELVSLYLCEKHYNMTIEDILEKIRQVSGPAKEISVEVFDIGYVTH